MNGQQIMNCEQFKRCEAFHGHVCPGLAVGFRAARAAMEQLGVKRAADEELVAIVETDACSADAIQVLTGCTFGKGNFFFKDYGKQVLTLASRDSGRAVRVSVRPGAFGRHQEHFELLQKVVQGRADDEERARFARLHLERTCHVLEMAADELFEIRPVAIDLPEYARIQQSEPCQVCGEPVMPAKLEEVSGRRVCRGCIEAGAA